MVKCAVCGKQMKVITNTHIKLHGIASVEEYRERFPNLPTHPEGYLKRLSNALMGKNKGNARPDARQRMKEHNPMKNAKSAKKMGQSRARGIAAGTIDVMKAFSHLPTAKETEFLRWLEANDIPLEYVGDGKKNIEGFFPDYINEDLKIILELELNFTSRPRKELSNKEKAYQAAGYKTIWVTKWDETYWNSWVLPHFRGGFSPSKIVRIWKEEHHHPVYNLEVEPNNTYVANRIVVHNCYANSFRASLYTSFFDNSRSMGIRHCNPDYYKRELDKLQPLRGQDPHGLTGIRKAFAMEIPVRLGIRFEDFLPIERRLGISLTLLEYLRDSAYPVMINTKSDLVGDERYVRALADNPAHAAVHVTLLSPNDRVNKDLEPGAPSYQRRMAAMRALSAAGVRVVARIEPYLFLVNDRADEIAQYAQDLVDAGVQHITFDTYSYSANVPGVRQAFMNCGYDFDRIFLAGCDSQQLGSLLLGKYMDEFRAYGLSCSTFDLGNVPHNDQDICCQVTDWFHTGWNYGSIVMAARYVISQNGAAVNWPQFHEYVMNHGGFLTEDLEQEVHALWNMDGNVAYSIHWAQGLIPVGWDAHGLVWAHQPRLDTREHILATLMEGMS